MKLVFAQGNPEPEYASTRHNIGFTVLDAIVGDNNSKWEKRAKFDAITAEIDINGEKVIFAKPTTYYNETGISARKIIDFYKINPETDMLIIHDDLTLPFGTVRVRNQGGDAGNNGIKSINSHINHPYTRIKIGIYNELREKVDDADFVLAKFSADEQQKMTESVIPKVIKLVGSFCDGNIELTSIKTEN